MAITSITITQDNKTGDSDLMAIHSPLVFVASVVYDTTPPDYVNVNLYKHTDYSGTKTLIDTFKAILYGDLDAITRQFIFIADGILRGYMGGFDEFSQEVNSIVYVDGFTQIFTIEFVDPDEENTLDSVDITALHAACQIGESPNKATIYLNTPEQFTGIPTAPTFIYFYNTDASKTPSYQINSGDVIDLIGDSAIGLFRVKCDGLTANTYIIKFYLDNVLTGTKTLVIKDVCTSDVVLLKYLDKNGYYRIFPFNMYWEGKDQPKSLGTTNELITSILTATTNTKQVGFKNNKQISLTSDQISSDELLQLSDLNISPRVYLSLDTNSDDNWVEVDIKAKTTTYKTRKGQFTKFDIDVNLPEDYTIKMI